jgi:putative tricarboxylic transport membrane protein
LHLFPVIYIVRHLRNADLFPAAGPRRDGAEVKPATTRQRLVPTIVLRSNYRATNVNGPEDGREEIVRPSTSLLRDLVRKRDFYAGGLMVLIGLGVALKGATYRTGTLMHMGPGFLPTALGVLLVFLGIAIAAAALSPSEDGHEEDQRILPANPQWWGWLCILAGPVLFIVLGHKFGMIPGTFACIFVSALGDRNATWTGTIVLATVVTAFGVGLFSYFLQVPMPILTWGSGL